MGVEFKWHFINTLEILGYDGYVYILIPNSTAEERK